MIDKFIKEEEVIHSKSDNETVSVLSKTTTVIFDPASQLQRGSENVGSRNKDLERTGDWCERIR